MAASGLVPDSEQGGLIGRLPAPYKDFALLARFDRPIGWWLLFWPGAWSIALHGDAISRWPLLLWFLVGSIAMRGAGCVYNDIVDRELDRKVKRTARRPLARKSVSLLLAWGWLMALCLVGLIVLMQMGREAKGIALMSLLLVGAYPFMKRITWWPQVWLGLVFSWAALVGWAELTGGIGGAGLTLYLGSVFWVIGYDSIYALQDREDDALVGIRSSALALGRYVRPGVAIFFALAVIFWAVAIWHMRPQLLALLALVPMAAHLGWQVATLREQDSDDALSKFRSNRYAGFLMFLACLVVGSAF